MDSNSVAEGKISGSCFVKERNPLNSLTYPDGAHTNPYRYTFCGNKAHLSATQWILYNKLTDSMSELAAGQKVISVDNSLLGILPTRY